MGSTSEHITFCRICEPYCGLVATVEAGAVARLRPDTAHVLSRGFACKKGLNAHRITHDPDRVTVPMRKVDGRWVRASWDDALGAIAARLGCIRSAHGPHAIAMYLGNPAAFHYPHRLYATGFMKGVGSRNVFGAGSTDNMSVLVACHLLFGSAVRLPIPDVPRTDFLLLLGVNPVVSHGTMINLHRPADALAAIGKRGGRLVVVDPRRTETARLADTWMPIRPDADAALLLAMLHVIFRDRLEDRAFLARNADGVAGVRALVSPRTPAWAAPITGLDADAITALAVDFATAPSAAAYGRVTCGRFGTLASWALLALNVVTGNLDRPGGSIFGDALLNLARLSRLAGLDAYGATRSRIGNHPDVFGELPVGILADEITTRDGPGHGQTQGRALIVDSGNPVLSSPKGSELRAAMGQLDLMVAIDLYLNETTEQADWFLPATTFLERADFPLLHASLHATPYAQWTDAVINPIGEAREEWTIYQALGDRLGVPVLGNAAAGWIRRGVESTGREMTPAMMVDALLRASPRGDWFMPHFRRGGLSIEHLRRYPHGILMEDFQRTGVLKKRVMHPGGKVALWHQEIADELSRYFAALEADATAAFPLQLIGRRDLRSHNTWMHNVPELMARRTRGVRLHPDDGAARGLCAGDLALVTSATGQIGPLPVEISDEMRPGVVSVPHGWSPDATSSRGVVRANLGPNVNALADRSIIEPLAGMAFLNGIPVEVRRSPRTERDT